MFIPTFFMQVNCSLMQSLAHLTSHLLTIRVLLCRSNFRDQARDIRLSHGLGCVPQQGATMKISLIQQQVLILFLMLSRSTEHI